MPDRRKLYLLVAAAVLAAGALRADGDPYKSKREALVRQIEHHARLAAFETGAPGISPAVLAVLGRLPRHEFVPQDRRDAAYDDRPLPIGHGQTISQPYIVALMTDLLKPQAGDRMLEIGTGSGYQAAVLAELVEKVSTIEVVEPLAREAVAKFERMGYRNIETRVADGYHGWEEHAPFDGIIVTAAASQIPPPLIRQLKPGARMVIPVGQPFLTQTLMLVEKLEDGSVRTREVLPVRFVPLVRRQRDI